MIAPGILAGRTGKASWKTESRNAGGYAHSGVAVSNGRFDLARHQIQQLRQTSPHVTHLAVYCVDINHTDYLSARI